MRSCYSKAVLVMIVTLGVAASFPCPAGAGYLYDEQIEGDLPHPNVATVIPFGTPNPNAILFTMDISSDGWILQVDPGETLRSFTLVAFDPDDPSYSASFHMYDGPTQEDPVLGVLWASFDLTFEGLDFMEHYGIPPLGPGQYLFNFWHDNSPGYPTLQFDINMTGLSPVESATWASIKDLYR